MTDERPTEPTPAGEGASETTPPPSAPPAYTPPTYTPPPVPPPAMPQPAVAWAPPPTSAPAAGRRTSLSLAAGILLVILGVLGGLFSLALLTVGREFIRQFDFTGLPGYTGGDPSAFVASVVTFLGIFVLVCSAFYVVGGVGVIRSANWGRVIGIVIGILAGLIWLGSLANGSQRGDVSFALVLLALHAYIAISLLFFWRNRAPTG